LSGAKWWWTDAAVPAITVAAAGLIDRENLVLSFIKLTPKTALFGTYFRRPPNIDREIARESC
jgi:hypothetical protein